MRIGAPHRACQWASRVFDPIIWCEGSGGISESKLLEHKVNVHEKMECRQVMRAVNCDLRFNHAVLSGPNGRICCYLLPDDRSLTVHGPRKNFRCHPIAFDANRMVSSPAFVGIYKVSYLAPDTPTVERIVHTAVSVTFTCSILYDTYFLLYSIWSWSPNLKPKSPKTFAKRGRYETLVDLSYRLCPCRYCRQHYRRPWSSPRTILATG